MAKAKVKPEETETEAAPAKGAKKTGYVYTYVGGGEASPHVINFMGLQQFVRGKATEVTDQRVVDKIANNPTFVEGEVEAEELAQYDTEASAKAEVQRRKDKATNAAFLKKHAGE